MRNTHVRFFAKRLSKSLLALIAVLSLWLIGTMSVLAATVNISDPVGLLNASQVSSEGSALPYPLNIYTTDTFSGTNQDFNQRAQSHLDTPNLIVMAIDSGRHYVAIVSGRDVPLSNSQANDAVRAFSSGYQNGGYTSATIAAIHSLRDSLASSSGSPGGVVPTSRGGTGIFGNVLFATLCCIGLIILALIVVFTFVRRRLFGFRRPNATPPPYNQPYNQPYSQPYNQYGPGQNQGGMNPWAAGGLGAAAGGLVGYELGKEQGERSERGEGWGGDQGGGNFGGGAGGDFGGGGGGNFGGGGGGDFGGGGDSGGGAGGSF